MAVDYSLPYGLLLIVFLGFILPAYAFMTGEFQWILGVFPAGVLFVVKWRWWWSPLREFIGMDEQKQPGS
jgi:hypothetical protein